MMKTILLLFAIVSKVAIADLTSYVDYTSTPVGTSAWVKIAGPTTTQIETISVFDSSGNTMQLGVGSPTTQIMLIPPGGGGFGQGINAGSNVYLKALNTASTSGVSIINFFYK